MTTKRKSKQQAVTLQEAEAAFARLIQDRDLEPTRIVLAAAAAHFLDDDPCWVMMLGGSSSGKTERLVPLEDYTPKLDGRYGALDKPSAVLISTISGEGALLSATKDNERTDKATGGLLCDFPYRVVNNKPFYSGIVVLKDFTSILEMDRNKRAQVIAALREIYDGKWIRSAGTDGAQKYPWQGKITIVAGCTSALDKHYSVISEMGPRFVYVRLRGNPPGALNAALDNAERSGPLRDAVRAAVHGLLDSPQPKHPLTPSVKKLIAGIASFTARARSPIVRDRGHLVDGARPDAEEPMRLGKQLVTLWNGAGLIGLDEQHSVKVLWRVSMDSLPKLRRDCLNILIHAGQKVSTPALAKELHWTVPTILRALEDLYYHGMVLQSGAGTKAEPFQWWLSDLARDWLSAAKIELRGEPTVVCPEVAATGSSSNGNGSAEDFEWHEPPPIEDPLAGYYVEFYSEDNVPDEPPVQEWSDDWEEGAGT